MKHTSFSQPYNWLCTAVTPLRPSYRYMATTLITSILIYSWYYLLYQPLQEYIRHTVTTLKTACHAREAHLQQPLSAPGLPVALEELRTLVDSYNKNWADEGINFIISCARQTGVRFISCSLDTHHQQGLGTREVVSCQCEGSFDQCINFFTKLFHTPHFYAPCSILTFTHSSTTTVGTLSFTLMILYAQQ